MASGCLGLFIIGISQRGASHPIGQVMIELAAAIVLDGSWRAGTRIILRPMLPIDLFRRPLFTLSAATAACSFAVQGLAFVALPFYFEDVLQRTQVEPAFS